jgi:hypothetical protein
MFRTAVASTHFHMLMFQSNGIFNCFLNSFKFFTLRPVAERTKKLSINYNIEPEPPLENDAGFNSKKWLAFINYVLCACPNLELLKIRIRVIKSANSQCFSNSINDVVEKVCLLSYF